MRVQVSCLCKATLDVESRFSSDAEAQVNAFYNAHAACRSRAAILASVREAVEGCERYTERETEKDGLACQAIDMHKDGEYIHRDDILAALDRLDTRR